MVCCRTGRRFTSSTMPDSAARIAVVRDGERLHVLEVTTTAPDAASGDANLVQKLGVMSPTPSLQLDFDVKIVTDDLSGVTLADLHISGNPCEASFGLGAFGGMNVGTTRSAVTQIPYANDWRHVTIALVADATSSTKYREVSSYGGAPFVDREAQISAGGPLTAACNFDTLRVGLLERGGGGAQATVHYDNILVRKLP